MGYPLETPFGNLTARLSKNNGRFSVCIVGAATINGVVYRTNLQLNSDDIGEEWRTNHFSLDRTDNKDAAFPFKARAEFEPAVIELWKKALQPVWLVQATEERRQIEIESLTDEIAQVEKTLTEKRQQLAKLQQGKTLWKAL